VRSRALNSCVVAARVAVVPYPTIKHTRSHIFTYTRSHYLSHGYTHNHTRIHTLAHTQSHTHGHTLAHKVTHTHTHTQSHSLQADPEVESLNRVRASLSRLAARSAGFSLPQPHLQRTRLCELPDEQLDPGYRAARDALRTRVKVRWVARE
jgi:hypothetical protein